MLDYLKVIFSILSAVFLLGCNDTHWTEINYVNLSKQKLLVEISGVTPNISPGVLLSGVGTSPLKRKTWNLEDPVVFDDEITIVWQIINEDAKKQVKLSRKDYGIPDIVKKGEVVFIYNELYTWSIKYNR
jgi:hypothetical protein